MDRTSRCEGSGGCWRGRHVYLAFSGAGVAGSYGWTGSGGPAYWPERTGRSTWICSGSGADVGIARYFVCCSCSYIAQTTDRIFQAGGCRGVGGSFFLYKDCLRTDYVFLFVIDADRTLYLSLIHILLRLLELLDKPINGKFDFKHLQAIHAYIFQDVYDWAGKVRTVDIAKGNMFCNVRFISSQADVIFSGLKEEHYLAGLDEDMEKIIAKCIKKK